MLRQVCYLHWLQTDFSQLVIWYLHRTNGPQPLLQQHPVKPCKQHVCHVHAEHTSQADDNTAEQDTSTVASSAAREASGTDAGQNTPHSAFQNHNGDSGYSNATNGFTDAEGVSVKKLIQRRSSESEVGEQQYLL